MNPRDPILCFGEVLWDCLPEGRFLGGAPVNVAFHLHRLGLRALPVTAVGRDEQGDAILGRLQAWGIDTVGVSSASRLPTGAVDVGLDAAGVPSYRIREGVAWDRIRLSGRLLAEAAGAGAVVFGTLAQRGGHNRRQLDRLRAQAPRARIILDVNLRPPFDAPERVWSSAGRVDLIKLNVEELHQLTGIGPDWESWRAAAALAARMECGRVCVTAGPRGAGLFWEGTWHWESGRPVTVRDTVGAGDAFLARLLKAWLVEEAAPAAMLAGACRLAEFVVSRHGATPEA